MINIKKIAPPMVIGIISIIFLNYLKNNLSGFTDIIFVIYYLIFLYSSIFISLFFYNKLKNKIISSMVSLIPTIIYIFSLSSNLREFLPYLFYLFLPLIGISILNIILVKILEKFKK